MNNRPPSWEACCLLDVVKQGLPYLVPLLPIESSNTSLTVFLLQPDEVFVNKSCILKRCCANGNPSEPTPIMRACVMRTNRSKTGFSLVVVSLSLVLLSGCAAHRQGGNLPTAGERLALHYSCRLPDGSLAVTTHKKIAEDPNVKKSEIFNPQGVYHPAEIVVPATPEQVTVDYMGSFEEKIVQSMARKATDLPLSREVDLELTGTVPENIPDNERFMQMALQTKLQRRMIVTLEEYQKEYPKPPVPGEILGADENFSTMVEKVEGEEVHLLFSSAPGATRKTVYGIEHFTQEEEEFLVRLEVKPGAVLRTGPLVGRISSVEQESFTIDYGHPFGGETLSCQVQALPVKNPGSAGPLTWLNSYEQGLALAKKEEKPVVLVLYADWCHWCHKMFDEVFPDQSFASLKNDFIWVRVNSDRNPGYMERFGQEGFPLLVVLDKEGNEIERLSGFQETGPLRGALDSILKKTGKS